MTYIIKCLMGSHVRDDFSIKAGESKEVAKEVYNFYNNNYGTSGKFTFETKGTVKKTIVPKVEKEIETEEVEVKEVKTRKTTKS